MCATSYHSFVLNKTFAGFKEKRPYKELILKKIHIALLIYVANKLTAFYNANIKHRSVKEDSRLNSEDQVIYSRQRE